MALIARLLLSQTMRRFILVLAVAFGCSILYFLNIKWYTALQDAEKISFWVAVGTVALAIVTAVSVWESQRILSQEDVRHQESYAPILTAEPHMQWGRTLCGFYIRNTGLGPAVVIKLVFSAEIEVVEYVDEVVEGRPRRTPVSRETKLLTYDKELDLVISAPGSRTVPLDLEVSGGIQSVRIDALSVSYRDVFGNPYVTDYSAYELTQPNRFTWVRPKIRAR